MLLFSAHYSQPLIQIRARFAGSLVARHRCRSSVLRATHFGRGTTNWPTNARQIIVAAKQRFVHVLLYSREPLFFLLFLLFCSFAFIYRGYLLSLREKGAGGEKAVKSKREGEVFIKLLSEPMFSINCAGDNKKYK